MYNRDIVAANIAKAEQARRLPLHKYSHAYIRACVDHLNTKAVLDDKGRFKELRTALLPDELAFISNERLMCSLDYDHWSTNYHRIRDSNTQEMVFFKRNFAQQALNSVYCEMQARGVPLMLQSLKARQLGVTTDTTARIQHRAQFIPNTSGVLASSDEDKTWKLSEMLQRSLREQPWWLLPEDLRTYVSGEVFLESPARNMTIGVQHGRQTSGISRGDTVNCYHLSELPDYNDAEGLIEAGLMKAMHPTRMTIGVKESTASGRNDYWHKLWKENQREYFAGRGLEQPIFLPWFMGVDIYPTQDWLLAAPIPSNWTPSDHIVDHAVKAREYVLANKILWQALGLDWHLPLRQMWYYSVLYDQAKSKGEEALAKFYSEMPANDLQAFQSRLGQVFSIELVQQYEDTAKQVVGVYGLKGYQVPQPLWPEAQQEVQGAPSIPVRHYCHSIDKLLEWELVPVRQDSLGPEQLDRLVVWEHPVRDAEYGVGLDGAEGKGLDRTSLPVIRKGTPYAPAEVVARLYSDKVATLEIWPVWLALLRYYSPVYRGEMSYALACPETNRGGDAAMMELRKHDWPAVYMRTKLDSARKLLSPKLGWETTPKTRDQLVQWVLMIIKGHYAQLNDLQLVDELRDLVVQELQSKIRLEAGYGSHDDLIFSFIITMVCLHGIDVYQASTPHWRRVLEDTATLLSFPTQPMLQLPTGEYEDASFTSQVEVVYASDSEDEPEFNIEDY